MSLPTTALGEGRGLIRQVPSLVLTREFQIDWSKIPFLGEMETVIRLGLNLGGGLAKVTPF